MKKTYIAPALKSEIAMTEDAILIAESFKLHDETVTGGWTKESGDWSDIWSSPAADAGVNP